MEVSAAASADDDSSTPRAGLGVGPNSFADPLDQLAHGEAKRRDQERLATAQLEEAMQMAMDLTRAAEDELSYHESSVTYEEFPMN